MYLSTQDVIGSVWISGISKTDRGIVFLTFLKFWELLRLMNPLMVFPEKKKKKRMHNHTTF